MASPGHSTAAVALDDLDRRIILASQGGLPLVPRPYQALGEAVGASEETVMARMAAMMAGGVIRRLGAVPNHYALGFVANGMTVWDVEDEALPALGPAVGALDFVSHAYHRPRHLPEWPYNLFAMVHGRNRADVAAHVAEIADLLGTACRGHDILWSTRILKKTGLRLRGGEA